jgi:hypothetical protein
LAAAVVASGTETSAARGTGSGVLELLGTLNNYRRNVMALLVPVLIGIPVVVGGGWVIYHFVH